jgi:glycosyltransferase involved in cell wall biosynthesis
MRGYLFQQAASDDFDVRVVVVPIAGGPSGVVPGVTVLPAWSPQELRAQLPVLLSQPAWRARFAAASPLPHAARQAPATLAAAVATAAAVAPGTPVHVARSYLAPLGIALAERLGSPWATLDLDDDDEQTAGVLSGDEEPAAYHRLIAVFGPLFRAVTLASPAEATAVSARHGLTITVIPNAVELPALAVPVGADSAVAAGGGDGADGVGGRDTAGVRVLFVGNLSYPPNRDAAWVLLREVLPRLRRLLPGPVTITLAGPTGEDAALALLGAQPGVRMLGFVPDLAACYRAADVVAAPLLTGSGTRIKLLEAMAHGVPVVTTTAGAAGLAASHETHLLIANSPSATAAAIARVAADPAIAGRLAASATQLVRERYSHAAVIPLIRDWLAVPATAPC